VEIRSAPWHADLHVSFTDDFRLATFRVAIPDNAATADFAVVDDIDAPEGSACEAIPATRSIVGSSHRSTSSSVSYLSHGAGPADYRIFARSKRFSARKAAALIEGAHGERTRLAASL